LWLFDFQDGVSGHLQTPMIRAKLARTAKTFVGDNDTNFIVALLKGLCAKALQAFVQPTVEVI
jgi:hypothetical protein